MTTCIPCYKDYISCGIETITVIGTLVADSPYTWILTTPQGAKYSDDVTTDEIGNFTIDVTTLPTGLLNPYAGIFTLTVKATDAYNCNSSTWNDSAYCTDYDCISFDVINGNENKNTLGCPCELI